MLLLQQDKTINHPTSQSIYWIESFQSLWNSIWNFAINFLAICLKKKTSWKHIISTFKFRCFRNKDFLAIFRCLGAMETQLVALHKSTKLSVRRPPKQSLLSPWSSGPSTSETASCSSMSPGWRERAALYTGEQKFKCRRHETHWFKLDI